MISVFLPDSGEKREFLISGVRGASGRIIAYKAADTRLWCRDQCVCLLDWWDREPLKLFGRPLYLFQV